jgi:hypothetical protein
MRTQLFLSSFLVICLVAPASVRSAEKEEPSKEVRKDVEKLVEQLGDNDIEVRENAAKKLREIGADALPTMRKSLEHQDAEIRRRLADLIPSIETTSALAPKIVTIDADKQSLKQIFDDLTKQTGYKFEFFNNNPNVTVTLKCEKKPLWQALDAISQETGLMVMAGYQDDTVRLQPQDAHVPYVSYDGAFRVVATGFQLTKTNNFGQVPRSNPTPQKTDSLLFNLMVYAEPKLPMLSVGQGTIEKAYDENKLSMNPAELDKNNPNNPLVSRSFYRSGGYRMFSTQSSTNLLMPGDSSRKVKYIKGSIPVTLVVSQKQELLTSEVLKVKGKQFESGNITIAVEDVTENPGGGVSLKMNITNNDNKKDANDYTWQNSIYQRMELQDEEGKKFGHGGSSWGSSGPGQMHLTLNFTPPGGGKAATKFLFQAWKTMDTEINFEFKDLPLP